MRSTPGAAATVGAATARDEHFRRGRSNYRHRNFRIHAILRAVPDNAIHSTNSIAGHSRQPRSACTNSAACWPSTTRWSNDDDRFISLRGTTAPPADHRPLDDAVDADDRHFRRVDDRRGHDAAERAQAGDGDRRSGELVARAPCPRARLRRGARSRAALDHRSRASAWRTTGTMSPAPVCVAMPMCTAA